MHDPSRPLSITGRVIPALTAVLLLTGILFLFRNPSATMTDVGEIANHASTLSMSDSAWFGNCWFPAGIEPPFPGEVAFGLHDVFPYKLFTIRDVITGYILVGIRSPITVSLDGIPRDDPQITAILKDTGAVVLIGDRNSESWPVYLFSIITDG